ncbi:MAG: sodium-dependent phosphate cotransporter [Marivirga sp.]
MLAIDLIGFSFKMLNNDIVESILRLTSNPFVGLFIGLLITALIQSSSTSTSMIVAIVASGSIGLSEAIPMIMGANIGTTLTSTLVSLSFITKKDEFRKAISAGVVHDFFNILVVIILFPLEYYYGWLSSLSTYISTLIVGNNYGDIQNEYSYSIMTKPIINWVGDLFPYPLILSVIAFALLAISIKIISNILYSSITGGSKEVLQKYFFGGPYRSFLWGAAITAGIQSSSVTTSVIVPFVATRRINLKQAFTFIMGANVGTTLTALIAATFKSEAAISIALVHLLFNLFGVIIFLPFPIIRKIPVRLAKGFGRLAINARLTGFVYIIFTFFVIPFILISYTNASQDKQELLYEVQDLTKGKVYFKKIVIKEFDANHLNHWFIYDQLNEKNAITDVPSEIVEAYYKKNLMVLNNIVFKTGQLNECWSGTDNLGKYNVCLKALNEKLVLANEMLDSLYLFEKVYVKDGTAKVTYVIDPKQHIIVNSSKYNENGKLIYTETLVSNLKL